MTQLDRTCSTTEEWSFLNHYKDVLKHPEPTWHFDRDELNAIAVIYFKLARENSRDFKQEMTRSRFREVLHTAFGLAGEDLMSGIFSALNIVGNVSLKTWIKTMSIFLRGSLKQQIKYCFKVYDSAGKHQIRREQMVSLMKKFVYMQHEEEVDETVNDLVDIVIKKMDIDKDGVISFDDYLTSVQQDPMMLECFGQCLPDRTHVYAFLLTFTDKIKGF